MAVALDFDASCRVLYAKRQGVHLVGSSFETPHDDGIILSKDAEGNVAGVTILVGNAELADWETHLDRELIPEDLRTALDAWFRG